MVAFLMLALGLLISGCVSVNTDWVSEMGPDEKWVSEDPNMYFVGWDEEKQSRYGEISLDGKVLEIDVAFDYGGNMAIFSYDPDYSQRKHLISCNCDFRGTEMTITFIERESAVKIFGESVGTSITFEKYVRQEDGSFAKA